MSDTTAKLDRIRALLKRFDAEAALISFLPDIRWATGFSGSNALLWIEGADAGARTGIGTGATLITDGRYRVQASREVPSAINIEIATGRLLDHLLQEDHLPGMPEKRRVCFQSDQLTFDQYQKLSGEMPQIDWVPASGMLTGLTAPKSDVEAAAITGALRITEAVFEELLSVIEPGISERDVAAEIVYRHLKQGADKMSFEPIVAAGRNASLPHGKPSNTEIRSGDLLLIDMGCFHDGYAGDLTRTIAVGEPDAEAQEVYQVVREALEAAHMAARAGITTKALDHAARAIIDKAGYGGYFSHGLGHGVGLQIHEWPRVSHSTDDEIPEGVVITLEPGIYIPDEIGVRIEDMVQITGDGCRLLTSLPRDLVQI